jgi:hypothetical protein
VAWARGKCQRIVAGEFDDEPFALFNVAHRMEVVLGQWQWLDTDFPRAVMPFVEGWNISGDDADRSIRRAARALLDDPAPDGPALKGSYGASLFRADEIADF